MGTFLSELSLAILLTLLLFYVTYKTAHKAIVIFKQEQEAFDHPPHVPYPIALTKASSQSNASSPTKAPLLVGYSINMDED